MKALVKHILAEEYSHAGPELDNVMRDIMSRKLVEMKKAIVAGTYVEEEVETIDEGKRFKVVRVRIRKGKVERRKRVSNVKGYTFRKKGSGAAKLIRMTPMERRKRRLGAKRGKIKRRGKAARIRQKMKRVRLKRKSLGLGYRNKSY
jgi:hypothetical protein